MSTTTSATLIDTTRAATRISPHQATDVTSWESSTGTDPRWTRYALAGLLGATALLYLWGLGSSGWANSFYSAAAQAGSVSWKAWFFGSSDAANAITVDKPPMALWFMGISARVFGVNAWSILVPQALMGVASVATLYATVKRWFGPAAGLLAGAVLATTPIATLMFRFNNPDALLVLLLTGAAYCLVRSVETSSTRWLVATWSLVGCAFLTKMLQALLVAPAFALVYLICADTPLRRRITQSIMGAFALIFSAGWYLAIVELWPKSARPYIGGSQHNSIIELTLGYNGLGRLTGNETGSANNGGVWGATGIGRLFNAEFGSQAAWFLPAALGFLAVGLWWTRRAPRTDRTRAALIIWGGWLLVTAAAFSFGKGIIHPYYTVALAPAIGALVGIGARLAWRRRQQWFGRIVLAAALLGTTVWAHTLLGRAPAWTPWLGTVVLASGIGLAVILVSAPHLNGRIGRLIAIAAVMVALAAPLAYSLETASSAHAGALPSAGPSQSRGFGPGGGFAPPRGRPNFGGGMPMAGQNGFRQGGPPNAGGLPPMFGATRRNQSGGARTGGLLEAGTSSAKINSLLKESGTSHRWAAAAIGSNTAAGFQLGSGQPVMAIGGFNGSDPSPTLAQFKALVEKGDIGWFIAGGDLRGPGARGASTSSEISSWVTSHFTATEVDGVTMYALTK